MIEALFVPEMNPRLVLEIDLRVEVVEQLAGGLDHRVFGFPGRVLIEVEHIVILHAPRWRLLRLMVPHRLEQATGGEHALIQTQRRQARKNLRIQRVFHGQFDQAFGSQRHIHSLNVGVWVKRLTLVIWPFQIIS